MSQSCLQSVASCDVPPSIAGIFLQRNCTLHNAIHSRQARVGPRVGVGVGVGVDLITPTPESESIPMKTLSTPQP